MRWRRQMLAASIIFSSAFLLLFGFQLQFVTAVFYASTFAYIAIAGAFAYLQVLESSRIDTCKRLRLAYRLTNLRQRIAISSNASLSASDLENDDQFLELEAVTADKLYAGDTVLVEAGQYIQADGVIVDGMALIDEAAVTGESTHVLREANGINAVMQDSLVVRGRLIVQVTPRRGHPLDWIAPRNTRRQLVNTKRQQVTSMASHIALR
jgi:high-affinity K+ transport system ATPase subunit B